jgi:RNA polymerase sigma-70 factor, ECF subfamily
MHTTPVSLLERLRRPGDQQAWAHFVDLYTPLIYSWARRRGLQAQDASDLVQDVFTLLVRKLPQFSYDRNKTFRGWLRAVTLNKWQENRRRQPPRMVNVRDAAEVAAPESDEAFWHVEYQQRLVGRALELIKGDFQPTTWEAFWAYMVQGRPPARVAADLGITVGAVHASRFRVLARLRQELEGQLD